jgi:hypothetical protein
MTPRRVSFKRRMSFWNLSSSGVDAFNLILPYLVHCLGIVGKTLIAFLSLQLLGSRRTRGMYAHFRDTHGIRAVGYQVYQLCPIYNTSRDENRLPYRRKTHTSPVIAPRQYDRLLCIPVILNIRHTCCISFWRLLRKSHTWI